MVDARRSRDAELLRTVSNPKDAAGLEHELASLTKRKSDLEDAELALMERLETAESAVAEQEALIAETNAEGARLSAEAKAVVAETTALLEQLELGVIQFAWLIINAIALSAFRIKPNRAGPRALADCRRDARVGLPPQADSIIA